MPVGISLKGCVEKINWVLTSFPQYIAQPPHLLYFIRGPTLGRIRFFTFCIQLHSLSSNVVELRVYKLFPINELPFCRYRSINISLFFNKSAWQSDMWASYASTITSSRCPYTDGSMSTASAGPPISSADTTRPPRPTTP